MNTVKKEFINLIPRRCFFKDLITIARINVLAAEELPNSQLQKTLQAMIFSLMENPLNKLTFNESTQTFIKSIGLSTPNKNALKSALEDLNAIKISSLCPDSKIEFNFHDVYLLATINNSTLCIELKNRLRRLQIRIKSPIKRALP